MKKQAANDWFDLISLADTAVIRDKHGDVFEKRGGLWCGHETKPLNDNEMRKFLPAIVLDNGHFPGRLAAAGAALAQTGVADTMADPTDIARIALEAADAWERTEFGGSPTITVYHDAEDSEESLRSYIHDALLDHEDENNLIHMTANEITEKVWDVIEERTATE